MATLQHATVDVTEMLPAPRGASGPRNDAERRLQALIQEGLDSGPPIRTTLPELIARLRARIHKQS